MRCAFRGGGRGDRRGSRVSEPPDCVKARRAGTTSALTLTSATLSSLFWDVLRLLRSGMVCTFLSEGECRDVTGDVRTESGMGVLISADEKREVLGRIGGGGGGLAEEKRRGGQTNGDGEEGTPPQLGRQGQGP